ncbi:hypothetical protein Tco_0014671 [Tanacetum coccineum]
MIVAKLGEGVVQGVDRDYEDRTTRKVMKRLRVRGNSQEVQVVPRKIIPMSQDDMSYSCLIEYSKHSALTARIWM